MAGYSVRSETMKRLNRKLSARLVSCNIGELYLCFSEAFSLPETRPVSSLLIMRTKFCLRSQARTYRAQHVEQK